MASIDLREAAQQALEAYSGGPNWRGFADAMDALKAALAEPVQCADNDSPWLICKPCAAEGVCKKAEPQEPDSPERRCGGPGCDMRCCQPVQEPAPMPPFPLVSLWKRGCAVCGIGAGGHAYGYACPRSDCPTRVTCGGTV